MARTARSKRKSPLREERRLERAKKMLAVPMDTEVVRLSLERAAEMEEFWRFMQQNRRILKPGSIKSSLACSGPEGDHRYAAASTTAG